MPARRASETRIFFPWEGRGGLRRYFAFGRVRPLIYAAALLTALVWIGVRERRDSGIRQTRATLLDMRRAVDTYIADHEGGCPESLDAARAYARLEEPARDAWGRPLRLVCPSDVPGLEYELMSDGPDGKPGGLDRIQ
jgi:general secretion pathway protein G